MQNNTAPQNKTESAINDLRNLTAKLDSQIAEYDTAIVRVNENYILSADDRNTLTVVYRVRQNKVERELHKVEARLATLRIREASQALASIF